jgi:hypothetical protein
MIEVLGLAGAWAAGMETRRVALLAAAVLAPAPASLLLGYAVWRGRRTEESRAASFCEAAASELRAGASLRRALEVSARSVGCLEGAELAAAGASLSDVADAIGEDLPEIGPELSLILVPAQRSGARVADLFDEIGSVTIARAEIIAEVRMSTSPVRATVLVLGMAPPAYLAVRGGLPVFEGAGGALALAGASLFFLGLGAVVWMLGRSR